MSILARAIQKVTASYCDVKIFLYINKFVEKYIDEYKIYLHNTEEPKNLVANVLNPFLQSYSIQRTHLVIIS